MNFDISFDIFRRRRRARRQAGISAQGGPASGWRDKLRRRHLSFVTISMSIIIPKAMGKSMKYLSRTIEYGLYLLVFLLPLQTRWIIKPGVLNNGPWEYGTYSLYGTDILLIAVLLLFVIYRFFDVSNFKFQISNLLIFGLVLASGVSVWFAADRTLALYKFGWLIMGVGLYWLIRRAGYDRARLVWSLILGVSLQAGLGIWQFLSQATFSSKWLGLARHLSGDLGTSVIEAVGADGIGERWLRAYGGLDHPNMLGGVLAVAILLLIGEIIRLGKVNFRFSIFDFRIVKKFQISDFPPKADQPRADKFQIKSGINKMGAIKISQWLMLPVFTTGLFFSFSRSAWLALGVGLAVMAGLAMVGRNLKLQRGLAEIILAMGILSLILFSQYQNLIVARLGGQSRLEIKSNSERLASYQESWQVIKNNWLLGAGLGNYTLAGYNAKMKICETAEYGTVDIARNYEKANQECQKISGYYYQPAHNVFLLVWAETGGVGVLFFAIMIIYAFVRLLRLQPQFKKLGLDPRNDSGAVILIALIVLMSLDHWLFSLHFGVLFFWLTLGLATHNSQPGAGIIVL